MSRYLIDRIAAQPNVEVLTHTEITGVDTDNSGALCRVAWRSRDTGATNERPIRHLFLFIGADPCTKWLHGCDATLDSKGFVLTGGLARLNESNPPSLMTSVDGLFAIGDVRSGSIKRAAAAVGEGAAVVAQIHAYLANRVPL
jgi:thioredoxin reductase (NADPH)